MKAKKVQIVNPSGFHLRPAGLLCQTSMKFKSSVKILHKEKEINAKSILNMMVSGIQYGTEVEIQCTGEDEEAALEAVCTLIEMGLGE